MKHLLLSMAVAMVSLSNQAQSPKDSLIAKERSIDRPITLHRGQLRFETGYGFSTVTKQFDSEGQSVDLRDEAKSFVRHMWLLDVRYGILENLHLQISTSYKTQSNLEEQIIITDANGVYQLTKIQSKAGLDDLLIAWSGRVPFTAKAWDIVGTAGIHIPLGSDKEGKPDHTVVKDSDGFRDITYRYNAQWGSGTPVATASGLVKYRIPYFAFTSSVVYNHPLKQSQGLRWQHQLLNNQFQYQSQPYSYQVPKGLNFSIEVERQLAPWFDLSVLVQGERLMPGWNEVTGYKVSSPENYFVSFNPGYEILVTPKIWLRQRLYFPASGKSHEAPFSIHTSLVYNFFPF